VSPAHGLPPRTVERIRAVLARFPEVDQAVLFGSRAKGTAKPGSDIDLSLRGDALDWRTVGRIHEALDDLLLPYRFSLIVLDHDLDPEVAAHVARVGIPFLPRPVPER
jgi:uncharacterized protein